MSVKQFIPSAFGLVIIESLREKDKKTGQILYDEVIRYKKFQEPNLTAVIHTINGKQELFDVLDELTIKVSEDAFFPLLHIEMHGHEGGLQLANGEDILWRELLPKFRKINVLLQNGFVLMLAACEGAGINVKIDPHDRAPFRAVVSAFKKESYLTMLKCFDAFYNDYFFNFDPFKAVELMNLEVSPEVNTFGVIKSEDFFDRMFDHQRDPENFNKMVERAAEYDIYNQPDLKNVPLHIVMIDARKKLLAILEDGKRDRDYFVMKDLRDSGQH